MTGYIYKITNSINEKVYIGQTIRSVKQRFKEHFHPSSGCVFLQRAMVKYGYENFKVEILEFINAESKSELIKILNRIEVQYININNSLFPNGYNGCLGGGNSADKKWAHGMPLESIAKRAENHKKPIKCNETNIVYKSVMDAAKELGFNKKFISRVLRGNRKSYKGLTFSYATNAGKPVAFKKKKVRPLDSYNLDGFTAQREKRKRPIKCNETGQYWGSIQEAADQFGVKNETIHRVLRGVRKHFRKLTFSYISPQS